MKKIAKKTNPSLWEQVKQQARSKFGGKHSAVAMAYATKLYKQKGGSYSSVKRSKTSMRKWLNEKWQYSSKKQQGKGRFLPARVWDKLTPSQKRAANQSKKKGTSQYVPYPKSINKVMRRSKIY